jgi:predicted DNA-binding transcriptional regulator YafY
VHRTLKPLGLVLKGGIWYLVAAVNDQARTYRVSNLVEVAGLAQKFERPNGFDLVAFWNTASRAYEAGLLEGTATLRLSPTGLIKLDVLGSAISHAARKSSGRPDENGWVTVSIPIESIEGAATDILRLGTDAEILGPVELRQRAARLVSDLARIYRD